jgi:cytoskeletal protein CcmA (bactofilin family)
MAAAPSVIGPSTVVRGNVRGPGGLEILGRVEGDVSVTGEVVLGEDGAVRGNVSGTKITILGMVQGDLRGTEAVLIERGAKVAGDVASPRIGIANGALVRGNVRTDGEPALTPGRRGGAVGTSLRGSFQTRAAAPPPKVEAKVVEVEPEAPRKSDVKGHPPPPVVPARGKGAKAKKKKSRESD